MFTEKDYHNLTRNSRRAIAKLDGFYCPTYCGDCPFYCRETITVNYDMEGVSHVHEGHCIVNAARVEFPDWNY